VPKVKTIRWYPDERAVGVGVDEQSTRWEPLLERGCMTAVHSLFFEGEGMLATALFKKTKRMSGIESTTRYFESK
jgi:hypothetical protein